jgi:hypothetical protein
MNSVRQLFGIPSKAQKLEAQAAQDAQVRAQRNAEEQAAVDTASAQTSGARLRLGGRRSLAFAGRDYSGALSPTLGG